MRRFKTPQTAFASGWMAVRGARRRRGYERVCAQRPCRLARPDRTIRESGARKVFVTHGQSEVLARYLRETEGIDAEPLDTLFEGESDDASSPVLMRGCRVRTC